MPEWKKYRAKTIYEARPIEPEETLKDLEIQDETIPVPGGMIFKAPAHPDKLFYVSAETFEKDFIEVEEAEEISVEPDAPAETYLFFDTETSGFIKKDLSFDDPEQAWCVQIGAILCTRDAILEELNILIKANGRPMNPHAEAIHGISIEVADRDGLTEVEAANAFGELLFKASKLVCHNFDFDWNYVYQLMQRNQDDLTDQARSAFYVDRPSFCTMKDPKVKKFVDARNKAGRIKWPRLEELYIKLFDTNFENAHDAMADIQATAKCFFELVDLGVIEE